MNTIEAMPLDEDQAQKLWDFSYDVEDVGVGSLAVAIAMDVARNTMQRGQSSMPHKEYGRRSGKCRRSVDTAVKRLKARGFIERIGTTSDGIAIYRAPAVAQ